MGLKHSLVDDASLGRIVGRKRAKITAGMLMTSLRLIKARR